MQREGFAREEKGMEMISTLLASKAAKVLASCVCPVAGATAVTMAVPQVRHAVHQATAPREYAKPKTRVRPVSQPPCPEAPALLAPDAPLAAVPLDIAAPEGVTPVAFGSRSTGDLGPGVGGEPLIPIELGPGVPTDGRPTTPVAAVPEVKTWVQLIVGFGLVGGATRLAYSRERPSPTPGLPDQNGRSPITLPPSA
jgi:hypothetical protein